MILLLCSLKWTYPLVQLTSDGEVDEEVCCQAVVVTHECSLLAPQTQADHVLQLLQRKRLPVPVTSTDVLKEFFFLLVIIR